MRVGETNAGRSRARSLRSTKARSSPIGEAEGSGARSARVRGSGTHPSGELLQSPAALRPGRGAGANVCPGVWRRPRAPAMNQLRGRSPGAGVTGRLLRGGGPEGPALLQFPVSLSTFGIPGTRRNLPSGLRGELSGPCNRALFPGLGGRDRWEGKWERPGKEKLRPESSIPLLCEGQGRSQDPVPGARYSCTESPVMPARPNPPGSVRKLLERTNSWVKLMIM